MLIDDYLPTYDASEYHEIEIRASREEVYAAAMNLNLSGLKISRLLMALRGLPALLRKQKVTTQAPRFNLDGLLESGFVLLGKAPQQELLLGLVGKFWKPTGNIWRIRADEFQSFNKKGFAKAAWNFAIDETSPDHTRLSTATRIACFDDASRWRFRLYWLFIKPFSGLIRREMLRAIRQEAENRMG
jgi:hypothetical protein